MERDVNSFNAHSSRRDVIALFEYLKTIFKKSGFARKDSRRRHVKDKYGLGDKLLNADLY